jgi:hypothetical protein
VLNAMYVEKRALLADLNELAADVYVQINFMFAEKPQTLIAHFPIFAQNKFYLAPSVDAVFVFMEIGEIFSPSSSQANK